MKTYFILLVSVLSLVACGGGSDGSNTSPTPDSTTAEQTDSASETSSSSESSSESSNTDNSSNYDESSNEEDTSQSADSQVFMTDLTISKTFDLKTDIPLIIDAKLSTGNSRAYINVCQSKEETKKADYGNCLLRKPLSQGELTQQITLSRQDISLVAEIWLYDTNPKPLRYNWHYDENLEQQRFEIRY